MWPVASSLAHQSQIFSPVNSSDCAIELDPRPPAPICPVLSPRSRAAPIFAILLAEEITASLQTRERRSTHRPSRRFAPANVRSSAHCPAMCEKPLPSAHQVRATSTGYRLAMTWASASDRLTAHCRWMNEPLAPPPVRATSAGYRATKGFTSAIVRWSAHNTAMWKRLSLHPSPCGQHGQRPTLPQGGRLANASHRNNRQKIGPP